MRVGARALAHAGRQLSPDAALLGAIRDGDEAAFVALYDRHAALAYSIALRICREVPAAEEAVEDAFVKVWQAAGRYDPSRGDAGAWIATIVRNRALDEVRRRRRDVSIEAATGQLGTRDATADRIELADALEGIDARQRMVLELAYFEGLTQREIAERTGLPLGTVKSLTRRGLETMRATLER